MTGFMGKLNQTCRQCIYGDPLDKDADFSQTTGICRRDPPRSGVWSTVRLDVDWCGVGNFSRPGEQSE